MNDSAIDHFIPSQSFGIAAGTAALITFILVSVAETFGREVVLATCLAAPFMTGLCSGWILGTSDTRGRGKAVLVGPLGLLVFYLLPVAFYFLELPVSRVFGIFFYLIVFIFPLGLLMSVGGAFFGSLIARAMGR